jgi:general secretion pathway protein D
MVFIRPTILRDGVSAAFETNAKYNVLRDQQMQRRKGRVTLLPGERQPLLPPIDELSKYADPTAGAKPPAADTEKPPVQTAPLNEGAQPSNQAPPNPPQSAPPPAQPQSRTEKAPDSAVDLRPHEE